MTYDLNAGHVEYHSCEWERMVEGGWMTATVDELPDGTRIAKMVRKPRERRWV